MNPHLKDTPERSLLTSIRSDSKSASHTAGLYQLMDNRPEAKLQADLSNMAQGSAAVAQLASMQGVANRGVVQRITNGQLGAIKREDCKVTAAFPISKGTIVHYNISHPDGDLQLHYHVESSYWGVRYAHEPTGKATKEAPGWMQMLACNYKWYDEVIKGAAAN